MTLGAGEGCSAPFDPPEARAPAKLPGAGLAPRPSCRRLLMVDRRTVTASASSTNAAGICGAIAQPMIRRLHASSTTARYSQLRWART